MPTLQQKIRTALGTVHDPDLRQDLVSLGIVQDLAVNDKQTNFRLVPLPARTAKFVEFARWWQRKSTNTCTRK